MEREREREIDRETKRDTFSLLQTDYCPPPERPGPWILPSCHVLDMAISYPGAIFVASRAAPGKRVARKTVTKIARNVYTYTHMPLYIYTYGIGNRRETRFNAGLTNFQGVSLNMDLFGEFTLLV